MLTIYITFNLLVAFVGHDPPPDIWTFLNFSKRFVLVILRLSASQSSLDQSLNSQCALQGLENGNSPFYSILDI